MRRYSDQERPVYALEQALERSQVENRQLRNALERIARRAVRQRHRKGGHVEYGSLVEAADIARAALAGTPSEDTE